MLHRLKYTLQHWYKTLPVHLGFAAIIIFFFYEMIPILKQYKPNTQIESRPPLLDITTHLVDPLFMLYPLLISLFLWIWLLYCSHSLSSKPKFKIFLTKIHTYLYQSLLWPIGLILLWGNHYTVEWILSIQTEHYQQGSGIGLSLVITTSVLLTFFTLIQIQQSNNIPRKIKTSFKTIAKQIKNNILHTLILLKASWKATIPAIFETFLILLPLSIMANSLPFFLKIPLPFIEIPFFIITWILFSGLAMLPIVTTLNIEKKLNAIHSQNKKNETP